MRLAASTFQALRQQIQQLCGIVLGEDKEYLVRHRLEPVIHERGLHSFEQLQAQLALGRDTALVEAVVNAVTTQETSFFRDPHLFEALSCQVLPALVSAFHERRTRIRIWSAGTSTGQEAYSLAMLVNEFTQQCLPTCQTREVFEIVATDISTAALAFASQGTYAARDVLRGVSPNRLQLHFEQHGDSYQVRESVRGLIRFQRLNLVQSLGGLGPFDLICCRNVMIYFDLAARRRFCEQCVTLLNHSGWLLLGAAENLYGVSQTLASIPLGTHGIVYRKL